MTVKRNGSGIAHAKRLIASGKINKESGWSFEASDGNALLGADGTDWKNYGWFHLAVDSDAEPNTKDYWKYPYGKNGQVYRSGVIAAKQRAAQQGATEIVNAADELLQSIDKKEKNMATHLMEILEHLRMMIVGMNSEHEDEEEYMRETKDGFVVFKQQDGQYRWFGWATNKWKDKEDEILTDIAHREFIEYLDKNPGKAPELWVWHTPGTARKNKADWWDYAHGFTMYSGLLMEEEAKAYENQEVEVGMSHGFYVLQKVGPYILKYRTFEVSELPLTAAANPYTNFHVLQEEMKEMFSPAKRRWLVDRLGEEKVASLEGSTEDREKALEAEGVDWKALSEEYEKELEDQLAQKIATASAANSKTLLETLMTEIVKALNIQQLQETLVQFNERIEQTAKAIARVEELEQKVNYLLETDDSKIAKALTPVEPIDWSLSATTRKDNVVPDAELTAEEKNQVAQAKGSLNWLKGMNPITEG